MSIKHPIYLCLATFGKNGFTFDLICFQFEKNKIADK